MRISDRSSDVCSSDLAGIGNYDLRLAEGVLNVPLSETVAVRFAGRYDERDGYFPNPYDGSRQGSVNASYYARGTLKWTPTELPITLTISGDYANYKDNGNPTRSEEHTSELQSLMRISYAVFCLQKKKKK